MDTRKKIQKRNCRIIKRWDESMRQYLNINSERQVIDLDTQEREMRMLLELVTRTKLILSEMLESIVKLQNSIDSTEGFKVIKNQYGVVHEQIHEMKTILPKMTQEWMDPDLRQEVLWSKLYWHLIMSQITQVMYNWMAPVAPDLTRELESITLLHKVPESKWGQKTKLWLSTARELEKFGIPKKDIGRRLKRLIIGSILNPYFKQWRKANAYDEPFSSQQLSQLIKSFNSGYFSMVMAKAGYVDQKRQERGRNKKPRPDEDRSTWTLRSHAKECLTKLYSDKRFLDKAIIPIKMSPYVEQLKHAATLYGYLSDRRRSHIPSLDPIIAMNRSEEVGDRDVDFLSRYVTWFEQQDRFIKEPENLYKLKQVPVFEPEGRDEAIICGYYGMQCPGCRGWRVKKAHDHKVQCTECQHIFEAQIATRCRYCDRQIIKDEAECVDGIRCPDCETLTDISNTADSILRFSERQLKRK